MSAPGAFPVAVVGLNPRGWHWLERFALRDDVAIAGVWDADASLRRNANEQGWPSFDTLDALFGRSHAAGVVIAAPLTTRAALATEALQAHRHVLTEPPIAISRSEAERIYDLAEQMGRCCLAASPRRWDDDVLAAKAALQEGRLGRLQTLRLTIAEWAPWATSSSSSRTNEAHVDSTFDLLGVPALDQLGEFTSAAATNVWVHRCDEEDGFLAVIALADGARLQLDVRRRSLAALHTGWILQGDGGAYRGRRIYVPAADGEIIDEPVRFEPSARDPLLDEWLHACPSASPDNQRIRGAQLADVCATLRSQLAASTH